MDLLAICDENNDFSLFSLGDELSDGICLIDKEGIIIKTNKEYSRVIGVLEKEMIGKHISYFEEKGYVDESIQLMVLKQKKKLSKIIKIKKNNNIALVTAIPIFNKKNEIEQILSVIRDLTEINNLRLKLQKIENSNQKYLRELKHIKSILKKTDGFIGESEGVKKLKDLILSVAKTDVTILITGETGCGKEVLAREIHKKSNRSDKPYIKINCAAIPESLIESELFGYEQGAFTGAQSKGKVGIFEAANGGTILLDEIGEMPIALQSKLLRVLQEKELTRIGGTRSLKLDIRIIAATNQNLEERVKDRLFRQDLYYRLNVIPIVIPPLRNRKEDIVLLAHSFLEKYNIKYNKNLLLDNKMVTSLEHYNWPGNVRELENVIERFVVISNENNLEFNSLDDLLLQQESVIDIECDNITLKCAVENFEKTIIKRALDMYGSTYKAAESLGMNQSSIYRKAKNFGLIN